MQHFVADMLCEKQPKSDLNFVIRHGLFVVAFFSFDTSKPNELIYVRFCRSDVSDTLMSPIK